MMTLDEQYPVLEVSAVAEQYPVSLAEAKDYCDYGESDRDDLFNSLIKMATEKVEHDTERAMCTQTVKAYFEDFPRVIYLNKPPVSAVSSITYVDQDGDTNTVATTVYQSDLKHIPPRICEKYSQVWPSDVSHDLLNAVTVTFTAGYGDSPDVPYLAKQAILLLVKRHFDGCESGEMDTPLYRGMVDSLRWRPLL